VTGPGDHPWWRGAVGYEVYVRSFTDSDRDGVGDLPGIQARLAYLRDLGVDALWLTPFFPSPMADHGYDVADPRDVDPSFGSLADFDALLSEAHTLGLRVTIDVVPNHSSDRHEWFRRALAAPPGSAERDRYIFRDGRGPGGSEPPNNWQSNFGGPAWTRVPDGQFYLHMFTLQQPDLNWRNPDVVTDYERTLRFWLDRGVDGFRIDVAHGLLKDAALRDNPGRWHRGMFGHGPEDKYSWNQPEVHEVYRSWRKIIDSYPGERMAVGEVWVREDDDLADYVRPDELHLAFNFKLLRAEWSPESLRRAVQESSTAMTKVGGIPCWVLSSHDSPRQVARYGGGEIGQRRARAAALLLLGLPGTAYLYAGEELGLPDAELPDSARQDPQWIRSGGGVHGRDAARVPIPWSGETSPFGFSEPGVEPWLPMPVEWRRFTVERESGSSGSMLELYREATRIRREHPDDGRRPVRWLDAAASCLAFRRAERLVCVVNAGSEPVPLPAGRVRLASEPLTGAVLPPDTAAWLETV
jgi:alpha-glucosidase